MQHRSRRSGRALLVALLAQAGACASEPTPRDEGRVAIAVAPLSLDGLSDASYALTVVNSGAQTVWTRTISSLQYGAGDGSVSYVGTCDADASPNTVQLVVTSLSDGDGPLTSGVDFINPAPPGDPLELVVPCVANQDTPVAFDLTVARAAQQGFFDISVDLQDLFCSAKLDCVDELLIRSTGARDLTAVLGFACTAGADSDTHLYMDDVVVTCTGDGTQTFTVDPSLGPGNLGASPDLLFQAAVYRGSEQLGAYHKAYWNIALGLDETAFAALSPCTLTARATVSDGPLDGSATPVGTRWPYVAWSVPLTNASDALVCTSHEVGGADGYVTITYSPTEGRTFGYAFDVAGATVLPTVDPRLAHSLRFDDTTDTVSIPVGTTLGGAATIEAWIRLDPASPLGMVYNEWAAGLEDKRLSAGPTGARAKLFAADNVYFTDPIDAETWHHVAAVGDGTTVRIYVDGQQVASGAAVTDIADDPGLPFLGAIYRDSALQPSFLGYLDALRVSDSARYTGASFTPPSRDLATDSSTLFLFNFEPEDFYTAGAVTKVVDHSGNGHDGTLGVGFTGATSPVPPPAPPAPPVTGPSCPATGADSVVTPFIGSQATVTWTVNNTYAFESYVYRAWGYSTAGDSYDDTRAIVLYGEGGADLTTGQQGTGMNCTAHSDGSGWTSFDPTVFFDGAAGTWGPQNSSWYEIECTFAAPVVVTGISSTGWDGSYNVGYRLLLGRGADGKLYPITANIGSATAITWGAANTYWLTALARPTCD